MFLFEFRWKCVGEGNGVMASTLNVKSSSTRCTIKEPPSSPVGHPALSYSANLLQHIAWAFHLFGLVQTNQLWWSDYLSDRDVHKLSCPEVYFLVLQTQ